MGKRNRGAFREPQVAKLEREGATSANDSESVQRMSTRDVPFRKLNSAGFAGRDARAAALATNSHTGHRWRKSVRPRTVRSTVQHKQPAPRTATISPHRSEASPPSSRRTRMTLHRTVRSRLRERMNCGSNRSGRKSDDPPATSCSNTDVCVRGNMGEPEATLRNAATIRCVPTSVGCGNGVRSSRRPCDKTRTWPPSTPQRSDPRLSSARNCLQTPNVYPIRCLNAMRLSALIRSTFCAAWGDQRVPRAGPALFFKYRETAPTGKTHDVVTSTAKPLFRQHKPCSPSRKFPRTQRLHVAGAGRSWGGGVSRRATVDSRWLDVDLIPRWSFGRDYLATEALQSQKTRPTCHGLHRGT